MTPRLIAAALDAAPIAGLTHGLGFGPEATPPVDGENPYLVLCAARAEVCLYVNQGSPGGVFAVAGRLGVKEYWLRPARLREGIVQILAWSLCACQPDPAAPETLAALRTPGLYSEVLRRHLTDRRDVLKALDFPDHRSLVAALSAALKETS